MIVLSLDQRVKGATLRNRSLGSDNPARGLPTRGLRDSVSGAGLGGFFKTDSLARVARDAHATEVVRLRAEGPATGLMVRNRAVPRRLVA